MAAVLACGEDALLSHLSAAELWGLLSSSAGVSDVSIPRAPGRPQRRGIRLHRSRTLAPRDRTLRRGIPVTTPPRTIADLRRTASEAQWRRAVRQAEVLGLPTGLEGQTDRTRSELERLFLRLCAAAGLPRPEVNVRVDRHLVDFLWRDRRLVVETDGFRYHRGRVAFQEDRGRDLDLRARGYDVLRFSYRQVTDEPQLVIRSLSRALKSR
jgi:very-short-patch-repair endonuclease